MIDDSEFLRTRRGSLFFGDDSTGSANISNSAVGRDLLDEPCALRALIASSCERDGRCEVGPLGREFSSRELEEYGGGNTLPVLDRAGGGRIELFLGLSLSVRLSCQLLANHIESMTTNAREPRFDQFPNQILFDKLEFKVTYK